MSNPSAGRRNITARQAAERFGVSIRTIQRTLAEPRDEWEARARDRHARIRALRAEGLSMRAIAEREGVSVGTVHYALSKPDQGAA